MNWLLQPLKNRRVIYIVCLELSSLGMAASIALLQSPSVAQPITRATVVEILDSDQVFIQDKKAGKKAVGQLNQQVRTALARAQLDFTERGAGVRLAQASSLIVGDTCIRLQKGEVLIAGNTGKVGCVGKIIATPRGTVYLMKLNEANQGLILVLEGRVDVANSDTPNAKPVSVGAGQGVTISPSGEVGAVQSFSQSQVQNAAGSLLADFRSSLPGLAKFAFLGEALRGFDDFDAQKGRTATNIQGTTVQGFFSRTGQNTGTFTPATTFTPFPGAPVIPAGTRIPITVDFKAGTITFSSIPLQPVANSVGLSGNQASGTVVYPNGQVIQVRAFSNGVVPPNPSTFPGSITPGQIKDR